MSIRLANYTSTLILTLTLGEPVAAQIGAPAPWPTAPAAPGAVAPGVAINPATGQPVTGALPAPGTPITYAAFDQTAQQQQQQQQQQKDQQEQQALMSAFGMLMQALGGQGGGAGGAGGGSSGGRSGRGAEFADGDYSESGPSSFVGPMKPVGSGELSGTKKIVPPFQKWFASCTKKMNLGDCKFENFGIMGDASHRARRSCHNSGEAIDVGPVTCSGGQKLTPSSPQFFELAKCMANDSNDELQVIFYKASGKNMMQKSDHSHHMHIQLKNCKMVYGS